MGAICLSIVDDVRISRTHMQNESIKTPNMFLLKSSTALVRIRVREISEI